MLFSELDLNKTYSYADYYKWEFDERLELINGKVFLMSPVPNRLHQEIVGDVFMSLTKFLQNKPCKVYVAPFDVRLPRKINDDKSIFTVLQPDVCVVCDTTKLDSKGCIGAPDIVVEVLSKGNNAKELKNKYAAYEEAGVREYWVVSPQNQTATIYTLIEGRFQPSRIMAQGDTIMSSVLVDFSLSLTELFRDIDSEED